ncbi:hypothetical protein FACS1894214_5170 [Planctomycetales bacterium]|nr:hypothetical protein FACS1894214_5170 [Planctomycetales bacterium]
MANELVNSLTFKGQVVRTVIDKRTDEILWIASDVCEALDLCNPSQALSRLDNDEKGVISNDTLGGVQKMLAEKFMLLPKPICKMFPEIVQQQLAAEGGAV